MSPPLATGKFAPVLKTSHVAELRKRWDAAKSIIHPIPPFEELMLGSVGRLGEQLLLLETIDDSWRILSVGPKVATWVAGAQRGAMLATLEPDFADALAEVARRALRLREPYLTERYFARGGLAQRHDLMALPLANRWGEPLVAAYIGERGPKYSLIDAIFRSTDDGVLALATVRGENDAPIDFQVVDLNLGAANLLGSAIEDLRWRRLSAGRHALSAPSSMRRLFDLVERGFADKFDIAANGSDGARHLGVSLSLMGDLICASITDITAVREREQSYRLLFEKNPMPMWIVDAETTAFLAVNKAAINHYGYDMDAFLAKRAADLCDEDHSSAFVAAVRGKGERGDRDGGWANLKADGCVIDVLFFGQDIEHNGRRARLLAIVDITERKRAEAEVAFLAHHDPLTRLGNRASFRERLTTAIERCAREGSKLAVGCIDLDLFKEVNDTFGHAAGDRVLQLAAQRIRRGIKSGDLAARLGGDEFAIAVFEIKDEAVASDIAARMVDNLALSYDIGVIDVNIGASLGVALYPDHGVTADELLKNADTALYRAKFDGRRHHRVFDREMDVSNQSRRALESELRDALRLDQFEVFYQPVIDIATSRVAGFEALLRWNHPERGLLSPGEFIPFAEASGQIISIGEWVLKTACAEAANWPASLKVAVNLSPAQFYSRGLVGSVALALANSGLARGRLELEITETALLSETESTLESLRQLRSMGVRIALDDFGTGYSSLAYLRRFPFDILKIDQSFVSDLADGEDCVAIVRSISGLARALGMSTIAEGVESHEQLDFLQAQGCDGAQGYLFSPAVPAGQVVDVLSRINGEVAAAKTQKRSA